MPAGEDIAQYLIGMGADLDQLDADMRTARAMVAQNIDQMNAKAGGLRLAFDTRAITGFIKDLGLIGLATAGAIAGIVELSDKIDRDLARALDIAGANSAVAGAKFQAFAEGLETSTGKSQNAIKGLGAVIATLSGVSGKDLENLTMIALGLERRFSQVGLTGRQAAEMLARGVKEGDLSGFEKFGISMRGTLNIQEQYRRVVDQANAGIEEMTGNAGTLGGAMARIRNVVIDVGRDFGSLFNLDGRSQSFWENAVGGVEELAAGFQISIQIIRDARDAFEDFLGIDLGPLADMAALIRELRDSMSALALLFYDLSPEEYAKAFEVVQMTSRQDAEQRAKDRDSERRKISDSFDGFGYKRPPANDSISTAFGELRIPSADAALRVQQEIRKEIQEFRKTYNQRMNEQRDRSGDFRGPNWVRR